MTASHPGPDRSPLTSAPLPPGSVLGVLGGGQLGRMMAIEARRMGYRVAVLDPASRCPAAQVADVHLQASFEDPAALEALVGQCQAVTLEFENLPAAAVAQIERHRPMRPGANALRVAQNREAEKAFLASLGIPVARYAPVPHLDAIDSAARVVGFPAVLKTSTSGYDGKGQRVVQSLEALQAAYLELGSVACVLEEWVPLERELSLIGARDVYGGLVCLPAAENVHVNGILDVSSVPARLTRDQAGQLEATVNRVLDALDYVGVLAVEFFLTRDGRLLANELAPRPHNSGHWSLEACDVNQFELQVRAAVGAPVIPTRLISPAATVNLLGDVWSSPPDWPALLATPGVRLHLYGKETPRIGRKMGHLTALAPSAEEAAQRALSARAALKGSATPSR